MNVVDLAILKKMIGGGSGTNNYNDLSNLPQINGETLTGNKTAANLGLQDALAFDSAPTEDSTNPVISGGVYSALTGKQDNLTFDGVYNASTNKAATESTVTNAIAGLDVSDFSVDADETISSISETDGKISVNKQDIAIASSQVVAMTGYAKPSSAPATPAIQQGDTANEAIGKLEYKADTNQTNILYVAENGVKNVFPVSFGTTSHSDGTLFDKIALHLIAGSWDFSWTSTATPTAGALVAYDSNKTEITRIAVPSGSTSFSGTLNLSQDAYYVTLYVGIDTTVSNIMCKPSWMSNDYQPPALPNYDLTRLEAEDRAGLVECVDGGAKNLLQLAATTNTSVSGCHVTFSGTASASATQWYGVEFTVPASGSYVFAVTATSGTIPTTALYNITDDANVKLYDNGTGGNDTVYLQTGKRYKVGSYLHSGTSYNQQLDVMICTLADWNVSHKCVQYRPNWDLVCQTLNDNTWVKSADLFPSHRTEFDVNNSHVYTYTNKFLNKVVVSIDLKAATEISSTTGVLSIASNIANIPPKPVFYDINDISNNFEYVILKNNANGSLAFKVTTGTISSGTTFSTQFEYTYGLN